MATPKTYFSELFYHKTSALRLELSSYNNQTRFRIEVIPAKEGQTRAFDYDNKIPMIFGYNEVLKIKKIFENLLTGVKQDTYALEHYFGEGEVKHKSVLTLKRVENRNAADVKSPFNFKYNVMLSIYNSQKNKSYSFGLGEEESYFIVNMAPLIAWQFVQENSRIVTENYADKRAGKETTGTPPSPSGNSSYAKKAPPVDESVDFGDTTGTQTSKPTVDADFENIEL
jgi:hypothetical protein